MKKIYIKRAVLMLLLLPCLFCIICKKSEIDNLPADGSLTKGFPITFYKQIFPENAPGPIENTSYTALAIDILFAFLVTIIVYEITRRTWNYFAWAIRIIRN